MFGVVVNTITVVSILYLLLNIKTFLLNWVFFPNREMY